MQGGDSGLGLVNPASGIVVSGGSWLRPLEGRVGALQASVCGLLLTGWGTPLGGLRFPVTPGLAASSPPGPCPSLSTISQPGLVSARGDLEAPIQCQNSSDTLASLRGCCPSPGHLSLCPCPWHPWSGLGGAALREGRVQGQCPGHLCCFLFVRRLARGLPGSAEVKTSPPKAGACRFNPCSGS